MKKWFLIALLLFSPLYALPLGNPMESTLYRRGFFDKKKKVETKVKAEKKTEAEIAPNVKAEAKTKIEVETKLTPGVESACCTLWSFRLGFYGDYVFQRSLERCSGAHPAIDHAEMFTNAGYLVLNACNRLDFFATFGATNFVLTSNAEVFGGSKNNFIDIVSDSDLSWSVGSRLALWNCDCFFFGIEGQYFRTRPDVERVIEPGAFLVYPKGIEMNYWEWQFGIGTSYYYKIECCCLAAIPYLGVKLSCSKLKFDDASIGSGHTLFDIKSRKHWGFATGLTLTFGEALGASVEGRFGDEKAVHVNGEFRF